VKEKLDVWDKFSAPFLECRGQYGIILYRYGGRNVDSKNDGRERGHRK
jgi:hypothetical protein